MKKLISMCLAMCMLFALFSVCVYADEPSDSMSKIHQNGTGYFTSYGSNNANNKTTKVINSYNSSTSLGRSLIFYSGNKPIQISFTCTVGNSRVVGQLSY